LSRLGWQSLGCKDEEATQRRSIAIGAYPKTRACGSEDGSGPQAVRNSPTTALGYIARGEKISVARRRANGEKCGLALHPDEAFQTCSERVHHGIKSRVRVIFTCPGPFGDFPRSRDLVLDHQTQALQIHPVLSEKLDDPPGSDHQVIPDPAEKNRFDSDDQSAVLRMDHRVSESAIMHGTAGSCHGSGSDHRNAAGIVPLPPDHGREAQETVK
jgi:hypothetical protein